MEDRVTLDRCRVTGKPCYPKKIAQSVKNKRRGQGVLLREYYCECCNWFHLTHEVPNRNNDFSRKKKRKMRYKYR